ncbi:type II toxin-antitoxin system VapC family toxin [Bifidobacterium avesanii]|uniref:DNA-binding protein n=1 Tax=Bifidobacterium avesanii TaxID=1798157 RepID=A0A7K3TJF7_9BIFI|nr:PIN domain-containing protein [Bifidobacterium avesanii]KAB8289910.1 PIN domain [Bifidobacterium avesanii]NEG78849.1 DNA-binding protein [Bifidobacterium avesanii]
MRNEEFRCSVMCDTNVLIYYMLCTPPFFLRVFDLFNLCAQQNIRMVCTALSLKDVFYITPGRFRDRYMEDESELVKSFASNMLPRVARTSVSQLRKMMAVLPVGDDECAAAEGLYGRHPDFEDNLLVAAAQRAGVRYMATYDKQLIRHFPELCMRPEDIAARLGDPTPA